MKLKKVLSFSLAALMLFSTFTGCTKKSDKQDEISSEEKKPTLKMLTGYFANVDLNNDIVAKDIEKTTGYKVVYTMLPQDKADEALNMKVAAGEEFDIFKIAPALFSSLVGQGAFVQLDDLLTNHGDNIKKYTDPSYWELTKYNNKIYGIPYVTERPNIGDCLAIRQDILDELGLKVPETPDEFYSVLKTIKEKKKIIPFTAAEGTNIPTIISGFGLLGGPTNVQDVKGTIMYTFKSPGYIDYLKFMVKLFNEGLLDPDWAINKVANRDEKFTSGKAAVTTYSWYDATRLKPALLKNVPNSKISIINPLKDKDGKQGIAMAQSLNNVIAIPKTSKNVEHAMKWMNLKQDPANFMFLTLGKEGETFKVENGNKYIPIMPALTEQRGNAYCYLTSKDDKKYADMWLARTRRDPALGEAFDELNKSVDKFGKINPIWDMPTVQSVSKYSASLDKMFLDEFSKVLLGAEKVENWEKFIQRWEAEGGAEIEKDINKWYQTKKK